jgi:hypothetical protein
MIFKTAVAGKPKPTVQCFKIIEKAFAFLSIPKIISLDNNIVWFIKRHFSNLDDENFERVKINHY